MTTTWLFDVFASSSAPHTSIPLRFRAPLCSMLHSFTPLVDKTPLFFGFWPEFLTIFPCLHYTVEASRILQSYAFIQHRLLFANSSAFSLPSVANLSNVAIFSFSFFVRCAFTCATSTKMPLVTNSCNSSHVYNHRSAFSGSWQNTLFLTVNYSFIIHMNLDGSANFSEEAQESCNLRRLDGPLNLIFCLHRTKHPMQWPHLFIVIQLYYCPTTGSTHASVYQQGAPSGDMVLEALCWQTPALVLLRLPLSHTEIASVPLTSTERMFNNTSLPLPLLL